MTTLEKKLDAGMKLNQQIKDLEAELKMKAGQMHDLLKDIAVNELSLPADSDGFPLPELLLKSFQKGQLK